MRRLDRAGIDPPANWEDLVRKALPDWDAFRAEAEKFELLDLNSPQRRAGFKRFAPQVLPKRRGKPDFPTLWGKAKLAISRMSSRKCAYCESPINATRSGQVEHFKPKSLFPSLAYDWSNYFLGCGGCNGAKSDKWPELGEYFRPDLGDPNAEFEWIEDGTMKARVAAGPGGLTVADFDLGERDWLVSIRKTMIEEELAEFQETVAELADVSPETAKRLLRNKYRRLRDNPKLPYTAALMQCLERAWKAAFPGELL